MLPQKIKNIFADYIKEIKIKIKIKFKAYYLFNFWTICGTNFKQVYLGQPIKQTHFFQN